MNPSASVHRSRNPSGQGGRLAEDVLAAARTLLEREGTESAVTLRGVARAVGVTAPSIYAHYADRDTLLQAVILAAWNDLAAAMTEALSAVPDEMPVLRLKTRARIYVRFGHRYPATYTILFSRPHPSPIPSVRRLAQQDFASWSADVAAAAPHLPKEDMRLTTTNMWANVHGLATLPPHHPRYPWPNIEALINQCVEHHLQVD